MIRYHVTMRGNNLEMLLLQEIEKTVFILSIIVTKHSAAASIKVLRKTFSQISLCSSLPEKHFSKS